MIDDGLGSVVMTGRWVGFYRHRSESQGAFPIIAEIRQEGNRITGEMYDQITDRSNFLEELLEWGREDLSSFHRLRIERTISQLGTGTVVVNSRLPDTSDLDGKITGDRVEFAKTYRGSWEFNWSVGGIELGSKERKRHQVHYCGHIDREKGFIAGEWTIWRPGLLGRILPAQGRGTFELYQKS